MQQMLKKYQHLTIATLEMRDNQQMLDQYQQ
jgi:hypothetical protein